MLVDTTSISCIQFSGRYVRICEQAILHNLSQFYSKTLSYIWTVQNSQFPQRTCNQFHIFINLFQQTAEIVASTDKLTTGPFRSQRDQI